MVDALRAQVVALTEELTTIKTELVNVKAAHTNLHQQSSEANTATARSFAEARTRVDALETQIGSGAMGKGGPEKKPRRERACCGHFRIYLARHTPSSSRRECAFFIMGHATEYGNIAIFFVYSAKLAITAYQNTITHILLLRVVILSDSSASSPSTRQNDFSRPQNAAFVLRLW